MSINDEDSFEQFLLDQSKVGDAYTEGKRLLMEHGVRFLDTEEGKAWFREYGQEWFENTSGKLVLGVLGVEAVKALFLINKKKWLGYDTTSRLVLKYGLEFLENGKGREWFKESGEAWLDSDDSGEFMCRCGVNFLETEMGKEWFKKNGKDWLESDAGKAWLKSEDGKLFQTLSVTSPHD